MRRLFLALILTAIAAVPGAAQPRAGVQALYDALRMDDVIELMQAEGLDYGEDLRAEMFPGRGGAAWSAQVETLYDPDAMQAIVMERFDALLGRVELDPLLEFYRSDLGQRIIGLEIEARRALMDEDIETAAKEALSRMRGAADPRLDVLDAFIEANDLVESNIVGAMNSNYAFYAGLMDGGAFAQDMTEDQVLNDVWSQEPEIRADTLEWVYSYLVLAYQPLGDTDIQDYTALSRTPKGRTLNQAIFGAFDAMYVTISRGLGRAAAQFIRGEDI